MSKRTGASSMVTLLPADDGPPIVNDSTCKPENGSRVENPLPYQIESAGLGLVVQGESPHRRRPHHWIRDLPSPTMQEMGTGPFDGRRSCQHFADHVTGLNVGELLVGARNSRRFKPRLQAG